MTISRLLDDPKAQAALHGRVLVVDEAGMVSGRQMEGMAAQEGEPATEDPQSSD